MKILTRKEKTRYGYYKDKMVAVDYPLALTLFSSGTELYTLNDDNTENLVVNVDDLITHEGLYGVRIV